MDERNNNLPSILPVGTAVVSRVEIKRRDGRPAHPAGAAGLIVQSPADVEHSYRVRFPGGDEVSLKRREMHVLSYYHRPDFDLRLDPLPRVERVSNAIRIVSCCPRLFCDFRW